MINGGLHPTLAVSLSEIYAWTVDFFGLQKGDNFKVIYEELYIDDKSLGIGKIYGAQFTWSGNTIIAVPFVQDGKESYYDSEGNSLRKAFLKAPLQFSRISSRFSSTEAHSTHARAMVGPMPSMAVNSASVASSRMGIDR